MSTFGNKPFGLRDIKITNITGTVTQVALPAAQKMSFKPMVTNGTLRGDDKIYSVVAFEDGLEWELEAGGIDLDALAKLTGRTVTAAGTTPNRTATMRGNGGDAYPYVKVYGRSLGDAGDDIHVKVYKAKVTEFEGEFGDGNFFMTKCKGIALDDGTNGIYQTVQNETATALPST